RVVELSDRNILEVDQVMFAIGRKPNTEGLGLETVGITVDDDGAIPVDEFSKTSADGVWAVGDVTNRINLTPVAIREGHAFADTEFNNKPTAFDHDTVPAAVFSQPSVSVVGLTEAQAEARFKIDIYQTDFRPMKNILAKDDERMFMKLVVRCSDDVVVGCHVVGPEAAEIVQMAAIAVKAGLTKRQWDETCALHPTAAEELVTLREKFVG
ncbi:MAG: FAD-dependent oxidoreductase, partial [Caulobacterales bacterium]